MNARDGDSVQAERAHEEYLAEVRQLVDEQVAALFQMVSAAAARIGATAASQGSDGRTLTVSGNGRSTTLAVEAVTDLPEGSDRAQEFPAGQARCTMTSGDGAAQEWVLHRIGEGQTVRYAWVDGNNQAQLDEAEIANRLQAALGMAPTGGEPVAAAGAGTASTVVTTGGSATGMPQGAATPIIPVDGDPSTIEEYNPTQ